MAKSVAIVLATIINYQLNKAWTWKQKGRNNQTLLKYILLYALSGTMNVLSNEFFLVVLPSAELVLNLDYPKEALDLPIFAVKIDKFFAVIFATIVGMIVNFIGQKLWVFKEKKSK